MFNMLHLNVGMKINSCQIKICRKENPPEINIPEGSFNALSNK